jgi:hypothetical protein
VAPQEHRIDVFKRAANAAKVHELGFPTTFLHGVDKETKEVIGIVLEFWFETRANHSDILNQFLQHDGMFVQSCLIQERYILYT